MAVIVAKKPPPTVVNVLAPILHYLLLMAYTAID
jgi:hypothetical protein